MLRQDTKGGQRPTGCLQEIITDKKLLEEQLHKLTGIPGSALRGSPLSQFSFDERVLWARNRDTKREGDLAHSLLGILDISIPVIYGEGKENAFRRLNRECKYQLDELSQTTLNYAKRFTILQQTLKRNTLASSAVNAFGDATVRFPPTWDNGCVPERAASSKLKKRAVCSKLQYNITSSFPLISAW
jgi:hypothetical protein